MDGRPGVAPNELPLEKASDRELFSVPEFSGLPGARVQLTPGGSKRTASLAFPFASYIRPGLACYTRC